jgi:hypothetical protein
MINVKEVGPPTDCYLKNSIDKKKSDNNRYVCLLNVDLVFSLPEVTT